MIKEFLNYIYCWTLAPMVGFVVNILSSICFNLNIFFSACKLLTRYFEEEKVKYTLNVIILRIKIK